MVRCALLACALLVALGTVVVHEVRSGQLHWKLAAGGGAAAAHRHLWDAAWAAAASSSGLAVAGDPGAAFHTGELPTSGWAHAWAGRGYVSVVGVLHAPCWLAGPRQPLLDWA